VDTVVLDKTGTLTYGQPAVHALVPAQGIQSAQLLEASASAELRSEHPLGKTIVAHARTLGHALQEPERFGYTPGLGIDAVLGGQLVLVGNQALMRGHGIAVPHQLLAGHRQASQVFVARAGQLLGAIVIADTVRPEAAAAIKAIHAMGIKTILLTGDARAVAEAVGRELGIAEVAAHLLPEDKQARVRALVAEGRIVAMVGDGINDAPALIEAQVGVAMGSGTDVARESADVVLLGNDLAKFAQTLSIARRTRAIIWANFAGTIGVDAVGIGLAAFGLLNPLLAAFIHVASELTFILNSARLLPSRSGRSGRRAAAGLLGGAEEGV
jgi:P-type E1-E2 ATPase